jgi:hypothetical protein
MASRTQRCTCRRRCRRRPRPAWAVTPADSGRKRPRPRRGRQTRKVKSFHVRYSKMASNESQDCMMHRNSQSLSGVVSAVLAKDLNQTKRRIVGICRFIGDLLRRHCAHDGTARGVV